ncbi:NAD(P)/FAD-dependent oxidoreductase [Streptomyces smyrnaeus]|uniref:NAD(P)/FAD-dependent oxidoreductase n=1 Tax=Streptomyces smyrnaeus TaxID=1387713 RepID=A0ABS3XWS9_9ACTN|nr:NAD(P)/FAD-dependent oxidoreductase [Streptomyces smyrnaeus]MBO8199771.1 NAD(P)/FAD-dependent oxidoreductase [Streptomyces smyrnaeus]
MSDSGTPVHIVGAGPGGLATAAALRERGISAVVLERTDAVGSSWRSHYDRLRLHTARVHSSLPGLPIPRAYGRWVRRADLVRYLEQYAAHHRIEVATGVEVHRLERADDEEGAPGPEGAQGAPDAHEAQGAPGTREAQGARWVLHANGGRRLLAPAVVMATGYNHTPYLPDWPGRDGFTGELLHASRYRSPAPYAGRDVLVVGAGNTGAEIAADLAEGGAGRVRLAVRTPPHILRRSTLGWPSQRSAILCRRLPVRLVDRMAAQLTKLSVPDLAPYGLPRPDAGLYTRAREGAIPVLDAGLVEAVRQGKVEPVAAVASFEDGKVLLTDGETVTPEVVIAATGYRRGLEDLVGHLGVLDPRGVPRVHGRRTHPAAPGLFFTGFSNPLSGGLRELALEARRIAKAVARSAG